MDKNPQGGDITLGARQNAGHAMQANKRNIYTRIFQLIDEDKGGTLDSKELRSALAKLGEHLTEEDALDMIAEISKVFMCSCSRMAGRKSI